MATYNGSAGNDIYTGSSASDLINGFDGDDVLTGVGGLDTIDGGASNDSLHGGEGDDQVNGGANNDFVYGDAGNDTLAGGDGNDFIDGGAGDDTLYNRGGDGADTIEGGAGYDTLTIDLTSADLTAGVRADLVALSDWMAAPNGELVLSDLGITVSGVEFLNLLVDGVNVDVASLANTPPSAETNVQLTVAEDGSVSGQAGAIDPDGGVLTWSVLKGTAFGDLALDPETGNYTYTAANNFSGTDSFVIRITDDAGLTIDQTVDVTVIGVADAPSLAVSGASVALDATLAGGASDDALSGGLGSDVIAGGDGNDVITGDSAAVMRDVPLDIIATLVDVDGSETLSFRVSGMPADSALSAGMQNADGSWALAAADLADLVMSTSATEDFKLTIEAISIEADGDTVTAMTSLPVSFSAAVGNDTIDGGAGDDLVDAGAGDDLVVHTVGEGFDTVLGGAGIDTVSIVLATDDLTPGVRADFAALATYLASHAEEDMVLLPALGLSLQSIENVVVTLDGAEVDLASLLVTAPVNTAPQAEAVVAATAVEDTLLAGVLAATDADGDELTWSLVEGPAHGTLTLDVATGGYAYTADADYSGVDSFLVAVADPSGAFVEQRVDVVIAAVADMPVLSISASASAGGVAASSLNGTKGNDTLTGSAGNDRIDAGKGNDLVYGDGAATNGPVALDIKAALTDLDGSEQLSIRVSGLPAGAALSAGQVNADGSWSLAPADLAGVQVTAPAGSSFTISVAATATEQSGVSATVEAALPVTFGLGNGAGNDHIRAGSGNDTVYGGDGNDTIHGGDGNDTLHDGNGTDKVYAGCGNDVLFAGAGDDLLRGGHGNDRIVAGLGHDIYRGGRGFDTLDLSTATAGVVVDVGKHTVGGGIDAEIHGFEAVIGSQHADTYVGTWSDDVFYAGAGNDTIRGSGGDDTMTGGAGSDTFIWTKHDVLHGKGHGCKGGPDVITDFGAGDHLDLHGLLSNLKGKPVTDFVKVKDTFWGTTVSVKIDNKFVDVVKLQGFHDNSAAHMIAQDMILI